MSEKKMEKVEVVEEQKDGFITRMIKNTWKDAMKISAGAAAGAGVTYMLGNKSSKQSTPISTPEFE